MNTVTENSTGTAADLLHPAQVDQARIDALIAAGRQERDRQLGLMAASAAGFLARVTAKVARELYRVTLLPLSLLLQKERLYDELSRLDDRLLRDIGMNRYDLAGTVDRHVIDAAYARPAAANQDSDRAAA